MQRQLEVVKQLQKQSDDAREARQREERAAREREEKARAAAQPKEPPPTWIAVELGGAALAGVGDANPWLVGALARVSWARGLLRLGGSVSLTGMHQSLDGGSVGISYFRTALALRAGVGTRTRWLDLDVTAGPGLSILYESAGAAGRHTLTSFVGVVGPRLAITLAGPIALVVGADLDISATDEKITLGAETPARFSRFAFELTVGIAWRSRH